MSKKLPEIELSEPVMKALADLERIEFDFSIESPRADKIEGRLVAFIREKKIKPDA